MFVILLMIDGAMIYQVLVIKVMITQVVVIMVMIDQLVVVIKTQEGSRLLYEWENITNQIYHHKENKYTCVKKVFHMAGNTQNMIKGDKNSCVRAKSMHCKFNIGN